MYPCTLSLNINNIKGHKADISCIDFIDDGSQILSGSNDSTVILWDCSKQQKVKQFGKLGLSRINQINLMNDNNDKILITASSNGYITFYDIKTGKEIIKINGCNGSNIECFSTFNQNNNCIITGTDNGMCYIYDIRKLNQTKNINYIGKIQRDEKCIKKIIKYNNDDELILCNPSGSIWKWNININKDMNNINNVKTMSEWTGNDQFGINDFVLMNNKLYVATKNYNIIEYPVL